MHHLLKSCFTSECKSHPIEERRGRGFVGVTVECKYVAGGGGVGGEREVLLKGLLMLQLQQLRLALAHNRPLGHTELYCLNNVASVTL